VRKLALDDLQLLPDGLSVGALAKAICPKLEVLTLLPVDPTRHSTLRRCPYSCVHYGHLGSHRIHLVDVSHFENMVVDGLRRSSPRNVQLFHEVLYRCKKIRKDWHDQDEAAEETRSVTMGVAALATLHLSTSLRKVYLAPVKPLADEISFYTMQPFCKEGDPKTVLRIKDIRRNMPCWNDGSLRSWHQGDL